jgi:hypothetical protein
MFLVFLLINLIYLFFIYKRTKVNMGKSIVEEISQSKEKILIYPEVASIRGSTSEIAKIKYDGIIYLTDKGIMFQHLFKKKRISIDLKDIKSVSETSEFMNAVRKGKKVCLIDLNDGHQVGLFVENNQLWQKKIMLEINKK